MFHCRPFCIEDLVFSVAYGEGSNLVACQLCVGEPALKSVPFTRCVLGKTDRIVFILYRIGFDPIGAFRAAIQFICDRIGVDLPDGVQRAEAVVLPFKPCEELIGVDRCAARIDGRITALFRRPAEEGITLAGKLFRQGEVSRCFITLNCLVNRSLRVEIPRHPIRRRIFVKRQGIHFHTPDCVQSNDRTFCGNKTIVQREVSAIRIDDLSLR